MTARPAVPPMRRRRPADELFEPVPEPAPAPPAKMRGTMVYLPASMVADLDRVRLEARLKYDQPIDRSALIRAAIRLALADEGQLVREAQED